MLKSKGAGETCHIISDIIELDGLDLPLRDALEEIESYILGSILCCVPGRLAYYKPEDPGTRYILEKKGPVHGG